MTFVADDIVCDTPSGRLEGADAFRGFMEPFTKILTRAELIAAFGDDRSTLLMYDTDTVPVPHAPAPSATPSRRARSPVLRSSSTCSRSPRRAQQPAPAESGT